MNPNASPRDLLNQIIPSLIAAVIAGLLFITIGETPPLRAAALAAVIGVMAFALRPMGRLFAIIGAVALAITPAYWSQTGGTETINPLWVIGALLAGMIISVVSYRLMRSATWGLALGGIAVVSAALIAQILGVTGSRSLRLTTLLSAAMLALLSDMVWRSNPRADSPPMRALLPSHLAFLLVTFTLGVINDPMIALFAPALVLAILLMRIQVTPLLWGVIAAIILFGAARLINLYHEPNYWVYPAESAIAADLHVPFVIGGAWREAERWVHLIGFLVSEFTAVGLALAVVGLARLSRWHAPVSMVTLAAFAAYALFGLLYFGGDATVLLLPLLMIQVFWITYALATVRDWITKIMTASRKWRGSQNPV